MDDLRHEGNRHCPPRYNPGSPVVMARHGSASHYGPHRPVAGSQATHARTHAGDRAAAARRI